MDLVGQWLPIVKEQMPWDAAIPGSATADVAIKRLMRCEASRVKGRRRVTVYMDLSAFYERGEHEDLIQSAMGLGFPELLLYLALSVYQGHRMVLVDGIVTPSFSVARGVLAGGPVATL